jgi:hypothetical protein
MTTRSSFSIHTSEVFGLWITLKTSNYAQWKEPRPPARWISPRLLYVLCAVLFWDHQSETVLGTLERRKPRDWRSSSVYHLTCWLGTFFFRARHSKTIIFVICTRCSQNLKRRGNVRLASAVFSATPMPWATAVWRCKFVSWVMC